LEEYQGNTQTQIKRLKEEIAKLQQNKEASKNKYKDLEDRFHEKSIESNEEIWHLRDHNEKLLSQIKMSKDKKQRLKKEKENLCLKTLKQKLLGQIKNFKNKEKDTKDKVNNSKNDEISRLKNHNQAIFTQIKKLKSDRKSLNDKLEQLQEVVSKSPVVSVQVEDKETNTDPIKIVTQAEYKHTELKTHAEVAVQTIDIPNHDSIANSTTTAPEGNQETTTNMIRESPTKKNI